MEAQGGGQAQSDTSVVVSAVGSVPLLEIVGGHGECLDETETSSFQRHNGQVRLDGVEERGVGVIGAAPGHKGAEGGDQIDQNVKSVRPRTPTHFGVLLAKGGLVEDWKGRVVVGKVGVDHAVDHLAGDEWLRLEPCGRKAVVLGSVLHQLLHGVSPLFVEFALVV